ncbi:hypothetical protein ACLOJK_028261 [Asimina triloba]
MKERAGSAPYTGEDEGRGIQRENGTSRQKQRRQKAAECDQRMKGGSAHCTWGGSSGIEGNPNREEIPTYAIMYSMRLRGDLGAKILELNEFTLILILLEIEDLPLCSTSLPGTVAEGATVAGREHREDAHPATGPITHRRGALVWCSTTTVQGGSPLVTFTAGSDRWIGPTQNDAVVDLFQPRQHAVANGNAFAVPIVATVVFFLAREPTIDRHMTTSPIAARRAKLVSFVVVEFAASSSDLSSSLISTTPSQWPDFYAHPVVDSSEAIYFVVAAGKPLDRMIYATHHNHDVGPNSPRLLRRRPPAVCLLSTHCRPLPWSTPLTASILNNIDIDRRPPAPSSPSRRQQHVGSISDMARPQQPTPMIDRASIDEAVVATKAAGKMKSSKSVK